MTARVTVVVALLGTACGAHPAFVGHGRHGSWQRVGEPAFTSGPSYRVEGVASPADGYGRWTAAGSVREGSSGRSRAAAWSSVDGSRWQRVELESGDVRSAVASAVAVGLGRAVVVGTAIRPTGDRDARIWTSTDGSTWNAVPLDDAVGGGAGDQSVTSVAAGPLGFVAAGVDRQRGRSDPAVWWSSDGVRWSRVGRGPGGPFLA